VAEGLFAAHIPAGTLVGRAGVDDDEAILLRQCVVWAAGVVCLRSASAEVNGNDDSRGRSELLGNVDEETCFRGGVEASDL